MEIWKKSFSQLQKIGKSLMLPVSVLPVAGLLLGVGAAHFTWMPDALSNIMAQSGAAIFGNLPLIFAIGVALGMTNNDGVSALASVIGYVVLLGTLGVMAKVFGVETKPIMGMDSIDTGVFGGIVMGGVAAFLFNRYYKIQLPPYLGFFAGKRFVPIVTALAAVFVGLILSVAWPPLGHGIQVFSHWAASENPPVAFTIYGVVERLLIPFGLHHIWNVPFFVEVGQYLDPVSGRTLTGEIARYISGDPTAGNLAGGYLFKMWGLPAAAFAMAHQAKPENRKRILGIMASAAFTSFLTGITEPIEFSFLFIAPGLYAIHALLSGLAFYVCIALKIKHGTTFSHGLIDYILLFSQSSRALWFFIIGPMWGAMYYGVFNYAIARFDLKTPGREINNEAGDAKATTSQDERIIGILTALGGATNLKSLDACITRLRVELKNSSLVDKNHLKDLGASGVVVLGQGVQVIFGTESENLKTRIEEYLQSPGASRQTATHSTPETSSPGIAIAPSEQMAQWKKALGGESNIRDFQPIAESRIRATVKDPSKMNEAELRSSGVQAIAKINDTTFHLLIGAPV